MKVCELVTAKEFEELESKIKELYNIVKGITNVLEVMDGNMAKGLESQTKLVAICDLMVTVHENEIKERNNNENS